MPPADACLRCKRTAELLFVLISSFHVEYIAQTGIRWGLRLRQTEYLATVPSRCHFVLWPVVSLDLPR